MNEKLKSYVDKQRAKGMDDEVIRRNLRKVGWDATTIDQAMVVHHSPTVEATPPPPSSELKHKHMTVVVPSSDFLKEQEEQAVVSQDNEPQTSNPDKVSPKQPSTETPTKPTPSPEEETQDDTTTTPKSVVSGSLGVLSQEETDSIYPGPVSHDKSVGSSQPVASVATPIPPGFNTVQPTTPAAQAPGTSAFVGGVAEAETETVLPQHATYISNPFATTALTWQYAKQKFFKITGLSALLSLILAVSGYYAASYLVFSVLITAFGGGTFNEYLVKFLLLYGVAICAFSIGAMLIARLHYRTLTSKSPVNFLIQSAQFTVFNVAVFGLYFLLSFTLLRTLVFSGMAGEADTAYSLYLIVTSVLTYAYLALVSLMPYSLFDSGRSVSTTIITVLRLSKGRRRETFGLLGVWAIISSLLGIALRVIVNSIESYEPAITTDNEVLFMAQIFMIIAAFIFPFVLLSMVFLGGYGYRYLAYRQLEQEEIKAPPVDVMNIVVIIVATISVVGTYFIQNNYSALPDTPSSGYDYNELSSDPYSTDTLSDYEPDSAAARDVERQSDINAIHSYLEMYYVDYGFYPASLDDLTMLNQEAQRPPLPGENYSFEPTQENGDSCSTEAGDCQEYNLYIHMETDQNGDGQVGAADTFERNSLNGSPSRE